MVKTPRTRHSKARHAPVTLDLSATEVQEQPDDVTRPPDEIDVSVTQKPVEELRETIFEAEAASTPESVETAIEEPVEDRIETESARTGADRIASGYSFSSSEAETPPPPTRGNRLSGVTGGLVGAAAALAALLGLQWTGLLPVLGGVQDPTPLIAPVQGEVSALKEEVAALRSAPAPDVTGLASSIEQIRTELAALKSANTGEAADTGALAALDARIGEVDGRLTAVAEAAGKEDGRLTALEQSVADAAGKEDSRLAALEQSLADLSGKLDQQASQPKVALSIAAAALKSALERGGRFSAELETLAAISPDAPELATLRTYAQAGIATDAELSAEIGPAADAMIAATTPVDENAGVVDRLLASARSMVRVRPVGDVAGDDVDARVARLENAVNSREYDKAVAEFDSLPDAAKAAGAAFAERLKARLEVTRLADQFVANALKAS